jgi:hypothetical protein
MLSGTWTDFIPSFVIISTIIGATWWLSNQFSILRKLMYTLTDETKRELISKIEYHERHDDQRFKSLTDDMWTIKVRNAVRDREIAEERVTHNKE